MSTETNEKHCWLLIGLAEPYPESIKKLFCFDCVTEGHHTVSAIKQLVNDARELGYYPHNVDDGDPLTDPSHGDPVSNRRGNKFVIEFRKLPESEEKSSERFKRAWPNCAAVGEGKTG